MCVAHILLVFCLFVLLLFGVVKKRISEIQIHTQWVSEIAYITKLTK